MNTTCTSILNLGQRSSDGSEMQIIAKAIISGVGQLNNPAYPNIAGLDTFQGPVVHSARWNHSVKYDGHVAVIGTGASSVQIVPELVKMAKKVLVYQRTPGYVVPRGNFKYTALFKWACRNIPYFLKVYRLLYILAFDALFITFKTWIPGLNTAFSYTLRAGMRAAIKDKILREKLTPKFPFGCKRMLISDDFLPALQQPNALIITDPILRVTKTGIVTKNEQGQDEKQDVDTIVLATGFKALDFLEPMDFFGKDGQRLRKIWSTGAEAYKGYTVSGFPNLFILYGPNTSLGHHSITFMVEASMNAVMGCLKDLFHPTYPTPYINVKKSVQDAYNKKLHKDLSHTAFAANCESWYRQKDGKIPTNFSGHVMSYWLMTRFVNPSDFEEVGDKSFVHARSVQTRNNLFAAAAAVSAAAVIVARLQSWS
ncbi:hypothetical protein HDU97_007469 [Phlyctochytrium planicorne]|nr:hypothetical protein HDU97_007469 [Phlyctochytrium planicorne]